MRLHTSNFAKHGSDPKAVSIAAKAPYWYKGKSLARLAPPWELVKSDATPEQYKEVYVRDVLSKFDPTQIAELVGEDAILLCWEAAGKFCHRQLVAEWMREAGIEIDELMPAPKPEPPKEPEAQLDLF